MNSQCTNATDTRSDEGHQKKAVAKRDGVFALVFYRISQFWPVRFVVRGLQTLGWLFGLSSPIKTPSTPTTEGRAFPDTRPCRSGRKRLGRATRLFLAILPRRLQGALGYPVCTNIGCSVSPDVRCSPTKPCGKGSKRKQDDIDEEEADQHSWVEALTQELTDEDQSVDPDYEPSAVETDSDEYRVYNDTESDLEVEKGVVVIKDLESVQGTTTEA